MSGFAKLWGEGDDQVLLTLEPNGETGGMGLVLRCLVLTETLMGVMVGYDTDDSARRAFEAMTEEAARRIVSAAKNDLKLKEGE
jgi:hypothetical protein